MTPKKSQRGFGTSLQTVNINNLNQENIIMNRVILLRYNNSNFNLHSAALECLALSYAYCNAAIRA